MLPALLLALLARAADGHLAAVGEVLGDAPVERVEVHPEYERLTVSLPGGVALPLEVTFARPDTSPACVHHGLAVYPRFELVGGEVLPEAAAATRALCARLEARGGDLDLRVVRVDAGGGPAPVTEAGGGRGIAISIPGPGAEPWRPLHAVLLALLACLLASVLPLRRALAGAPWLDAVGVAVAGLLARLLLSPRGLMIAPDAGYERIVEAWGINQAHPLYGDGYAALHAPVQRLADFDPAALFALHLGLSALAPPLLWAVAWLLLRERWGALTAGLGLALLPVALRLAGSEVAHVPLASFELLAVLGAVAYLARGGPALAGVGALALGFAVHLRPEALPAVALGGGLLAAGTWRHRAARASLAAGLVALLVLGGLALARLSTLPTPEGPGPVNPQAFLSPDFWAAGLTPRTSPLAERSGPFQVFLDLRTTPAVLPLLALLGLTAGLWRHPRVVALAVAWWGLVLVPILPKAFPLVDAWRLQLAGQAPLLLLAGVGVASLPRWRLLAPLAVALSLPGHTTQVRQQWAGMAEWAFLPEALGRLPAGATVLFADHEVHGAKVAQVGALLHHRAGEARPWWVPMGPFAADPQPGPDLFAWVGLTCRIARLPGRRVDNDAAVNACLQLDQACTLTPFATTTLPETTDLDLSWLSTPVEVGLYRLDGCGEPRVDSAGDEG